MRSSALGRGLLLLVVAAVGILFIAPTVIVVAASFGSTGGLDFPPQGFSLQWYSRFFSDTWLPAAGNSLRVAAITALLSTILGTAGAFSLVRGQYPGKAIVQSVLIAPLIVPTVILGVGVFQVFTTWGIAGGTWGYVVAHTALAIPFVVITVSASLRTVDPVLERAAASLGANPVSCFLRVTVPLIMPGLVAGALFAFITSLDEVAVATFLASPEMTTLPVQIYSTLQNALDPTVAAISALLLAVTLLVILLPLVLQRGGRSRSIA